MSISEVYALLVIQCHYPPNYVLDEMEWYEIGAALKFSHYSVKQQWEMARLIGYITAQVQSTKKLKYEDIVKLPWDDENKVEDVEDTSITKADIERLKVLAESYLKKQ